MAWTPDYATEVERSIDNHLGDLLKLHVAKIDAPTVARVLTRVDRKGVSMSRKVRTRVRAIFEHAITEGLIALSPVPATRRRRAGPKRNYPAVIDREGVGKILRDAHKSDVCRGIRRAHELIAHTAQRSGEIVPAEWTEFDLDSDAPTWTIPRSRMKMKKGERGNHLVPIPPGLRALLKTWKAEDGDGAVYVCPAPRSKGHVTADALEKYYRRSLGLKGKHVPHSWRKVWKTWGGDAGRPFDQLESQLDHSNIGGKIAGSYDEAARLEPRREIAAWYEGELTAARDGATEAPVSPADNVCLTMPQLPSGTHVAAEPAPLRELLKDAGSAFNAHDIMALASADDLLRWVDMLVLDPDDQASSTPVGRLSAWQAYADAHEWNDADRLAMREFVTECVLPSMTRIMDTNVRDAQAALLQAPTTAGALARCWREGVHPLQVEPE